MGGLDPAIQRERYTDCAMWHWMAGSGPAKTKVARIRAAELDSEVADCPFKELTQ